MERLIRKAFHTVMMYSIYKMSFNKKIDVMDAHRYCSNNKPELGKGEKCGCFYCMRIFNSIEIEDWIINEENDTDKFGTAICPYCGIDSVIGESSGYDITEDFLNKMHQQWFHNV